MSHGHSYEKIYQILEQISPHIVQLVAEETGENVHIMGQGGTIIATTQPERKGTVHEGAKKMLDGEIDEAFITEEDAKLLEGVKPGYTAPIIYNDERIAGLGVSGDPNRTKPIARISIRVVESMIVRELSNDEVRQAAEEVHARVQQATAYVEEISSSANQMAASSHNAASTTEEVGNKMEKVNTILEAISEIASRSNLLGLNAAIEAARAGEHGKGFSVVATEIRKMANSSAKSVEETSQVITEIKDYFNQIAKLVGENDTLVQTQTSTLQEVTAQLTDINSQMESLTREFNG
ncbi:MAG: chemotaxis protein [Firmicutes bacterium]|nr:chemotaxis protein [Bacillota bacterium]